MSTVTRLRIATRSSRLAMWQSEHVAALLQARDPQLVIEFVALTTAGDRILDQPLAKIGGKGLFIKELELAILDGRADVAVHSMKDVPAELPAELVITSVLARDDPRDVLVSHNGGDLAALAPGSRVGTSSLRRRSQLLMQRPDLAVVDLRGNVPTRLKRLSDNQFDAVVLAAAGLSRLGLLDGRCHTLGVESMLPAVAQGAIGIEARAGDTAVRELVGTLNCDETAACVGAERAMNRTLGGSCQVPIAGHARIDGDTLSMAALVAAIDGTEVLRQTANGAITDAVGLGRRVGQALLAIGAGRILETLDGA